MEAGLLTDYKRLLLLEETLRDAVRAELAAVEMAY
jgi:hypothetical protein